MNPTPSATDGGTSASGKPDGTEDDEQVPLTPEDVLFPEEDDFIVQTDFHAIDMTYLRAVFNARLAGNRRA